MSQAGDSWERRAAGLATEVQRWLIRTSARNMRDELGDQVKKAFRGRDSEPADVWGAATTEPPHAAEEPPECAWCPICRAARRIAESRAAAEARPGAAAGGAARAGGENRQAGDSRPGSEAQSGSDIRGVSETSGATASRSGPALSDAAEVVAAASDVVAGAFRDALAGLESILSYRPPEDSPTAADQPGAAKPSTARPGGDRAEEPEDEPGHRG